VEIMVLKAFLFLGLLFIVLLVLKLTDTIDWSWLWITAPLWGGFAAGAGSCLPEYSICLCDD